MRDLLEKYFIRGQNIELIYLSKSNEISKRRVKILNVQENSFQVYCFKRKAKRTFLLMNVLAIAPVSQKESKVI
ncbi:transcriptional regulator [Psychrobacillus soli]|uniref:Transcriptional regulator n=1 Tax=Psychrobacillus soli TaxID=1543965 RepID=A0A544T9L8_9BACI|nr:transcriptional regulator [Psychrobacillus soli]TQR14154.1 transcriptional regulator [Psychrobacillus soli]